MQTNYGAIKEKTALIKERLTYDTLVSHRNDLKYVREKFIARACN